MLFQRKNEGPLLVQYKVWKLKWACPHWRAEDCRKQLGRNVTEIIKALDCPSLEPFGPWILSPSLYSIPSPLLWDTGRWLHWQCLNVKNPVVQIAGFFSCVENFPVFPLTFLNVTIGLTSAWGFLHEEGELLFKRWLRKLLSPGHC